MRKTLPIAILVLTVLAGCARPPSEHKRPRGPVPSVAQLAFTGWELTRLGERDLPRGDDDDALTLRFEVQTAKVQGFAGCNRYTASYLVSIDRLTFGGPVTTRKHCAGHMDLEQDYLAMLGKVIRYTRSAEGLVLYGVDGELARFTPRAR